MTKRILLNPFYLSRNSVGFKNKRPRRIYISIAFTAATLIFFQFGSLGAKGGERLMIIPTGDPQTIYRWSVDKCNPDFIPDAPARAFKRKDGLIALIASTSENWSLVGSSILSVKPKCKTILSSMRYTQPKTGKLWIEATYTIDGSNIISLISQDLTEYEKSIGCRPENKLGRCWLGNIVSAKSEDMGETFALFPRAVRTIATLGDKYPLSTSTRFGAFTVTNIIRYGHFFYMMVYLQGEGLQEPGNCLFRTDNIDSPDSWRAWNGSEFGTEMTSFANPSPCFTIKSLPSEVRSINFIPSRSLWVATYSSRLKLEGDIKPIPGFYYSVSTNLLDWEPPRLLLLAPTKPRELQNDYIDWYPSLIDPKSKSINFDTIDSGEAFLFFTRQHLVNGSGSMNRDLEFVPVKID